MSNIVKFMPKISEEMDRHEREVMINVILLSEDVKYMFKELEKPVTLEARKNIHEILTRQIKKVKEYKLAHRETLENVLARYGHVGKIRFED